MTLPREYYRNRKRQEQLLSDVRELVEVKYPRLPMKLRYRLINCLFLKACAKNNV